MSGPWPHLTWDEFLAVQAVIERAAPGSDQREGIVSARQKIAEAASFREVTPKQGKDEKGRAVDNY